MDNTLHNTINTCHRCNVSDATVFPAGCYKYPLHRSIEHCVKALEQQLTEWKETADFNEDCIKDAARQLKEMRQEKEQAEAQLQQVMGERDRMINAIEWACGIRGSFKPPDPSSNRYWWRNYLRLKAGLEYNEGCTKLVAQALSQKANDSPTPEADIQPDQPQA